MDIPYYVTLTGSKNNAGDYLIRSQGVQLLSNLRKDRALVDMDRWSALTVDQLHIINKSKALIILGGPAIVGSMIPSIIPLTEKLDNIKVPIILFGVGWYSISGSWSDTHKVRFNRQTTSLLKRIENQEFYSSVRDYSTLNTLMFNGYSNYVMSGCPALYDLEKIGSDFELKPLEQIKSVIFSSGVTFSNSRRIFNIKKKLILRLKEFFNQSELIVAFHHSIDPKQYSNSYGRKNKLFRSQIEMTKWLIKSKISFIDISGSADQLKNLYSSTDLHIGFRVHAHIFTSSISKPSILISEDGRGMALRDVLNGLNINSNEAVKGIKLSNFLRKLNYPPKYAPNEDLPDDVINNIRYELQNEGPRLKRTRNNIDEHFAVMKSFIKQLP